MDIFAKMLIVQYNLLSTHFAGNLIKGFARMLIVRIYSDISLSCIRCNNISHLSHTPSQTFFSNNQYLFLEGKQGTFSWNIY